MSTTHVQIRQCTREGCGLRFPYLMGSERGARCPRCRAETRLIEAQIIPLEPTPGDQPESWLHLEALLDNVRSAWNVGAMFRTADGVGIRKMHLAGITATPDHQRVAKTALGAETSLPWDYYPDGVAAARLLKEQGYSLWALEQAARSEPLDQIRKTDFITPVVLVVGNEISGVDPGILELCERVIDLPMRGSKRSLNAAVAFGIAVYTFQILSQGSRSILPNT